MNLEDKIKELNKYVDGSLCFTHYCSGWELRSYKDNTLFGIGCFLRATTFNEVVNKAYKLMLEDLKK